MIFLFLLILNLNLGAMQEVCIEHTDQLQLDKLYNKMYDSCEWKNVLEKRAEILAQNNMLQIKVKSLQELVKNWAESNEDYKEYDRLIRKECSSFEQHKNYFYANQFDPFLPIGNNNKEKIRACVKITFSDWNKIKKIFRDSCLEDRIGTSSPAGLPDNYWSDEEKNALKKMKKRFLSSIISLHDIYKYPDFFDAFVDKKLTNNLLYNDGGLVLNGSSKFVKKLPRLQCLSEKNRHLHIPMLCVLNPFKDKDVVLSSFTKQEKLLPIDIKHISRVTLKDCQRLNIWNDDINNLNGVLRIHNGREKKESDLSYGFEVTKKILSLDISGLPRVYVDLFNQKNNKPGSIELRRIKACIFSDFGGNDWGGVIKDWKSEFENVQYLKDGYKSFVVKAYSEKYYEKYGTECLAIKN